MAREHKMTAWDAGNDLCACADYLGEKEQELHNGGFDVHAELLRDFDAERTSMFEYFFRLGISKDWPPFFLERLP